MEKNKLSKISLTAGITLTCLGIITIATNFFGKVYALSTLDARVTTLEDKFQDYVDTAREASKTTSEAIVQIKSDVAWLKDYFKK